MSQQQLPLEGERQIWSVSEILEETRWALEKAFNGIWVRGEVTGLRALRSGHWYFGLKDDDAVLPVAMFRGDNRSVPFELEEGLEVTACGNLTLYAPQGRFQLVAKTLEPAGWGARQLAYEQLKRRLADEGLFDEDRKRPLPLLPRCVGVVTSAQGAAWHDMRKVWERRGVAVRALLAPATVQGEFAATEIVAAIELLQQHGAAEVIIIGRGGGSREDLWAFNEEPVARAVAASRVPTISAVGHEIDFAITDLVADRRAATPTAAAEIVAPSRDELMQRVDGLHRRVRQGCTGAVSRAARRLHEPRLTRALSEPARAVGTHQQHVDLAWELVEAALDSALQGARDSLGKVGNALVRHEPTALLARSERRMLALRDRFRAAFATRVQQRRGRLGAAAARTEALSPLAVLGRGYALCQDAEGLLLRGANETTVGAAVSVQLARGRLQCEVTRTEAHGDER